MRVVVDVMGGDHAPLETVMGAVQAAKEVNASFILVGDRDEINRISDEQGIDLRRFDIVHTTEVITMEDDPLSVVRAKKESSMSVGLRLLAHGEGDVFVSAGNTGALFTGATLIVRKVRGIQRAAIAASLPTPEPCLLLDTGANVLVTEEYLEQFAVMGSAYVRKVYGIEAPRVGLLNNGTEDTKGTPLQIETNKRLRECGSISYVGNVEGNAVPFGACNVLVSDGFTGNVFLKTMEGVGKFILGEVKQMFAENNLTRLSALLARKSILEMKKKFDSAEHGGAPFLGICKPVVKAHGSSDARAFKNAIKEAVRYAESGVIYDIAEEAERFAAAKRAEREAAKAEEAMAEAPADGQETHKG